MLNSLAMAKPCAGRSSIRESTRWSSTDGLYSLTVTNLGLSQRPQRRRAVFLALAALASSWVVSGPLPAHASSTVVKGSITVSAAASLTDAFRSLARDFQRAHPQVKVVFNFGSTTALVSQVQAGAPADVFAAADTASIDRLRTSGLVSAPSRIFAVNTLGLAVKRGNPLHIRSVADLQKAKVVSLCAKTVPCGVYASKVIQRAGLALAESNITRGIDAKATVGAVVNGDADAAVVYVTDIAASARLVTTITIPTAQNVIAKYSITTLQRAKNAVAAHAFLQYVTSSAGVQTMTRFGFGRP